MKVIKLMIVFFLSIIFCFCSSDDVNEEVNKSGNEQNLILELELEYNNSIFSTVISDNEITPKRLLPYDAKQIKVKSLRLSNGTKANLKEGDLLEISNQSLIITVDCEDGLSSFNYTVNLPKYEYASIVEKHGRLQVKGSEIVGKDGQSVSLAGNSFFWSNEGWGGNRYYNASVVSWLKLDWGTTIIRAAMGVDESGGYLENKTANVNSLKTLVDAAIDEGLYVIIDWHSHHAEDYPNEAVEFFSEMARLYGEYDNIIYEIYNEPLDVSWDKVIKPYAEKVIAAIRQHDPDHLIVVGTPEWSQRVDLAAENPITGYSNIAYVMHFYSVHHQQWLRDRTNAAMDSGLPIMVTEWGSLGYTQNDPETEKWMEWCKARQIIHCNWAVNDKQEEWSIVKPGVSVVGNWKEYNLTQAGKLARSIIREW
ncbi:glycoside hydrolase family 5 protein [Labilibacter sediminis]|nr:glycoside hydrolase family 5 protein [Labilibacter sediminis]